MDALNLLAKARAAALTVRAEGDQLVISGPKRAEAVALLLLKHKAAVMAALARGEPKNVEAVSQRSPGAEPGRGQRLCPRSENPHSPASTRITVQGKTFDLQKSAGMWFFRPQSYPEAGWTCCSDEFTGLIDQPPIHPGSGAGSRAGDYGPEGNSNGRIKGTKGVRDVRQEFGGKHHRRLQLGVAADAKP
jgi:hypothetical protein